ncbi:ABC transporter ATP-binding protein/permease [Microvenator marinus]|uniref:ABC transporter ATP-binding protein/permease n=1 Tax=Microvenator marinus TaxID=2600177 RepID=A0A5B8XJ29_9DELT|nr:ABC transporter ATP-binding protein/permease [Microvenator marinus]QED25762.1 ABC transporter ATP-binding protein/permease [Microvenator marinus]
MAKRRDPNPRENDLKSDTPFFKMLWTFVPYLKDHWVRAVVSIILLLSVKGATVTIPLVLKEIVDYLDAGDAALVAIPLGMLLAYGGLRAASTVFKELQTVVFARVRYGLSRSISAALLRHLHALSLRYHLERKTGSLTRDIDRGTNSISNLLNYLVFNIFPTIVEVLMVTSILLANYSLGFALIILVSFIVYVIFTLVVTRWRMQFRSAMNNKDSIASSFAIDSLLNFETVKYFGNERFEIDRYTRTLKEYEDASIKSQASMSFLNGGQGLIIAAGVTAVMLLAASEVASGLMSIGDLVAVNAFLLQMFMPLGFLGMIYTIVKNSAADMERMFVILNTEPEIKDRPGATRLNVEPNTADVRFELVSFHYESERPILHDVSFEIPAGKKVAIVGPSGSGKSTLARLLYRFYDVSSGRITINGQDIRDVEQESLRDAIGIVPQDTVLFNDTLRYNIKYGRLDATDDEIERAAEMAYLKDFIASLPDGWDTIVGERGLKLSGGEKQRVAIARAILKDPEILIFDEATSSLDSGSENAILKAMREVSSARTTLTIAHRLSTIVDSDQIVVLEFGRVVERGTHRELLELNGHYSKLWSLQQAEDVGADSEPYHAA